MAATESIVSANNKPASPYRGSGYRSIAFGTWAVGDASRRFQQQQQSRRRGQSSSVAPGKRGGIGEEAATENSQRGIKMASGSKQSATQQPQQSTADQPSNRQSAAAGTSPAHPLCHSLIDIRRHATNDQQQPTALTTQSMNHRLLVAEQPQQEDFYSSSEYVRHSAVGSGPAEHNYENAAASLLASMPALACCNHRSLETLHLASVPLSAHHQPSCSSPASSRISCPPYSQPSSQPHQHQSKQQQQLRFGGFVIDPLRSGGGRRKATKQRPTTAEGPPATGMRNRTKSLDNGLKFSLASRHRRVGEGGGDHSLAVDLGNISTTSNRPPAPTVAKDAEAQQQHSRLDQAKQFLRRFYASSTMRLARRKWKEATAEQQQQQQQSSADGALMFSSAMGPFFELRRPCEEELPLLPYNIHYAVESVDDGDEEEDDQEDEEAEADSSSVSVEWTECSAHHPQQPVTHHFHQHQLQQQQQYSMGAASTPVGRRHPPAPSTSRRAISFQDQQQQQQQQSAAANQSMLANGSPTLLTPGSSASASGLVATSQQQSAWISSTTSSSSSSSSGGRELTLLAGASTSLILDSSSNNQQSGCTFTFACSSASMPTSSNSPDSAIGTSPSAEDSPSAPSGCCGSLSSSDSSAETTKRNRPTTAKEQSAAGNQHNQQRQQPTAAAHRGGGEAGPAERRFANWNELFQYLRREIMEMNVRDAQILRNLETIQAEMNGMRQLQQQQKRKPRLDWNNKTHHQQHHLGSRQQMSKSYSHPN